jgi:hypothetical protein
MVALSKLAKVVTLLTCLQGAWIRHQPEYSERFFVYHSPSLADDGTIHQTHTLFPIYRTSFQNGQKALLPEFEA